VAGLLQNSHGRANNIARMRYGVNEFDQVLRKPPLHGIAQHLAADGIGSREKRREANIQPFQQSRDAAVGTPTAPQRRQVTG
jgi:hypothetical protein